MRRKIIILTKCTYCVRDIKIGSAIMIQITLLNDIINFTHKLYKIRYNINFSFINYIIL